MAAWQALAMALPAVRVGRTAGGHEGFPSGHERATE
jgi:hypothetical protein